jgi:LemA protein
MIGILTLIIIVLIVLYIISLYNNVIRKRNETEKAFGSVDALLKKRFDLIPNLVEIVKKYDQYESSVFLEVTKIRSQFTNSQTSNEKFELHASLTKQMGNLLVNLENYPSLKANENFLKLQAAWNETEEQISAARRYYNSAVTEYNNSIQTFPANILLDAAKFTPKKVFETDDMERQNINAQKLF